MGRLVPHQIRILALIAALALVHGCKEREQLEKEAPALARADLRVDRIAIAGVVSDVAALGDSAGSRASWSEMIGDHLGRERFGKLPIVTYSEVRAILGPDDHRLVLDRFKEDGGCDDVVLAELDTIFEGKARFIVFGNIRDDGVAWSDSESEIVDEKTKIVTSRTKTMTTSRSTSIRLRFYDLSDHRLAWDHLTVGQAATSKQHDMSDVVEHSPKEGFFGGLITSLVNSAIKPEPKYPPAPGVERSLADAFDNVGAYLKPPKQK